MAKSRNNNINIAIFTALKVSEYSKVPTLLIGNPGCGKSTAVAMFAEVRGYKVVMLRGNSESPESIMGYDVAPKEVTYDRPMAAIHLRPSWFEEVLRNDMSGRKTLLFLDEITTANEFVQAALLHLIFERKCGKESLPESTLIVAAGNYAGNISSSMSMMPPVMNRFMIFNIIPDHTDLDTFLNKYTGAYVNEDGKPDDYMKELKSTMKKMDSQEVAILPEHEGKIGELIERNIRETTRMIMTTNGKKIDMSVNNLNDIYSDTEDDRLDGFVTMRTLNYLRDVTFAFYKCFGKAGISSDNYRNAVDGLCGIGVSKDPKTKDIIKNHVGGEYYNSIQLTINEIEKMKNDKLPKYERFFIDITGVKDEKTGKRKEKTELSNEEVITIVNKFKELLNDKDIQSIERPVAAENISTICKIIKTYSKKKVTFSGGDAVTSYPVDSLAGSIVQWNNITDLINILDNFVSDAKYNYGYEVLQEIKDSQKELRSSGCRLRLMKQLIAKSNPAVEKIIPAIKSIKGM